MAAIAFSSAGPVYYDRVTGEIGPYGALMDYLRHVDARFPLLALDVRDLLWAEYNARAGSEDRGVHLAGHYAVDGNGRLEAPDRPRRAGDGGPLPEPSGLA